MAAAGHAVADHKREWNLNFGGNGLQTRFRDFWRRIVARTRAGEKCSGRPIF